jgi:nucleotide-binding universal stress UspA family protein
MAMVASNRFNRILLATDGSEQAQAAVAATIAFASPSATVKVVHVWNLEVRHRHGTRDIEVRSEAETLVDATVARLLAAGLIAQREICRADSNHVAAAIAVSAREFKADVVVVGSRGLSDWQSMRQYSVSHELLCAVDCPILIVRAPLHAEKARGRRILLAIAGGDDLAPGVKAAVAAATTAGSIVMVVHVAQALFGAQGFAYVESEEEIEATMATAIKLVEDAGVEAQGMVAHAGPVAPVVAEIAEGWKADLIVSGSSRMGDLGSMFLGSVSHDLLRATDRPVLIAERVGA